MSAPNELERLEQTALKNSATPERVERIWRRLELELPSEEPRARRVWVPVSALVMFGVGIFALGIMVGRLPATTPMASVSPEPVKALTPAPHRPSHAATPTAEVAPRRAAHNPSRTAISSTPEVVTDPVVSETVVPAPVSSAASAVVEWQELYKQNRYSEAWAALDNVGGFDAVCQSASADALSNCLYYLAIGSNHPGQALQVLRTIINRFPGTDDADSATWSLARALGDRGDWAGAAQAYAEYERNFPQGDWVEPALFNQIAIAANQGNRAQVIELADRYVRQFPNNKRRSAVLQMRSMAETGQAAGDGGVDDPSTSLVDDSDDTAPVDSATPAQH